MLGGAQRPGQGAFSPDHVLAHPAWRGELRPGKTGLVVGRLGRGAVWPAPGPAEVNACIFDLQFCVSAFLLLSWKSNTFLSFCAGQLVAENEDTLAFEYRVVPIAT